MPRESTARAAERRVHATPAPKTVQKGSQRRATASITPEAAAPLVDLDFVRGLIEALDESSLDSLEISRAGTRIRMAKTPPPPMVNGVAPPQLQMPTMMAAPAAQPPSSPPAQQPSEVPAPPKSNLSDVKSPMVGTFYRAPAPEAPPYVEIGSTVRKGQTLCILEAMKLMNELECEVDGVVREILAENADPVEYGQVLFRIEPA